MVEHVTRLPMMLCVGIHTCTNLWLSPIVGPSLFKLSRMLHRIKVSSNICKMLCTWWRGIRKLRYLAMTSRFTTMIVISLRDTYLTIVSLLVLVLCVCYLILLHEYIFILMDFPFTLIVTVITTTYGITRCMML